ncbi:helix-hairpin-helix domain-containing protein [Marinobacter halotolerans]|uniref:helix-hairpin-helix domain-containing protein n=1 Tax=Marinobacter halotolerans TaxID=1569211 RepID=UPI001245B85A|nr:helix-hairpin-helix domain-containing protein [Marinobacter halotolerans]
MGKKASKQNVDKVVEKVNKEFEKTSQRIEKLMNDAIKQFDGVQNQVQEPVRKLLKEIDELREREVKRFTDEFDRRMDEFHELQNSVMERLGLSSSKSSASKKTAPKKSTAKKPAAKKTAAKKTATKKPAVKKTATKKPASTARKPAAASKKPAAAAKAADSSDLTRVKGIGPATAKKMKDAGITDISQIANPSADDQAKLSAFSNVKGFSTFSAEAKKVL